MNEKNVENKIYSRKFDKYLEDTVDLSWFMIFSVVLDVTLIMV